ncbi:hypothetical protein D9M70_563540 [compost metagenome]
MKDTLGAKPGRQCDGRNSEGKPQRLHEVVFRKTEGLQIGHGGNDEDPGAAGRHAGQRSDNRREPPFLSLSNAERPRKQRVAGIDDERGPERGGGQPCVPTHQPCGAEQRSGDNRQHHRPEPSRDRQDAGSRQKLPDVGHEGRNNQQTCRRDR